LAHSGQDGPIALSASPVRQCPSLYPRATRTAVLRDSCWTLWFLLFAVHSHLRWSIRVSSLCVAFSRKKGKGTRWVAVRATLFSPSCALIACLAYHLCLLLDLLFWLAFAGWEDGTGRVLTCLDCLWTFWASACYMPPLFTHVPCMTFPCDQGSSAFYHPFLKHKPPLTKDIHLSFFHWLTPRTALCCIASCCIWAHLPRNFSLLRYTWQAGWFPTMCLLLFKTPTRRAGCASTC